MSFFLNALKLHGNKDLFNPFNDDGKKNLNAMYVIDILENT